jgi:PAS domain S-box-containing protein
MQPGVSRSVEYRFKHRNGTYLTLESVGKATVGTDETSVIVNSRDISERKLAEEALAESEEKYRIVADNTYDWEFWLSPAGTFLYMSPSCKRVTGYDVAQFEEDPQFLYSVIHPDDRDYFRTHRDNVEKRMAADEIAFRIIGPEGDVRWIGHVCQPVFDSEGTFIGTRGSNRDITDRKRAADALRESEEKYRALMNDAGDAIFLSDVEGAVIDANRKAEELTGYTRKELLDMRIGDIMHDDHRKHGLAAFKEVVAGGLARLPEGVIRRKDGTKVVVDVVARLIKYGDTSAAQAILRDVTERRKAEEALRRSEARYRAIVEDQTELVCRFLPDGTLTFVNDAYCRYFGKSREDLLGSRFTPLIPQEDRPLIEAYMRTLGPANPVASLEHRAIDASGQVRWQRWTDRAIFAREGSIVEYQSVGRDITDQKQAGDALRASEQRFRMLVENLPQKIFLKDERSVYLYCNGNFARDLKISQEEILGKTDFDLYPPKSANKHIAEDREVIEHRKPLSMEARYEKDGRHVMIHLTKTPILDDEGNVKGILGIIWDITERARLESIAEAVNTTENIGYVFSGIRHEIGNPINSLKITLSVLRSKAHEYSKEMCLTYIERAMSEIARVEYLLKALKSYNLYEVPDIRDINIREFLDKFASLVAADCAQRGVSLQVNLGHDAESGRADPRALQQVLLNILVNSLDALKGRDNPMVKIQTSRENGAIKISVTDNGIGMTEEQQKDLFKPFRTTKATGTGLGLVIAMKMLTRMKGTISVQSRKGEGTTTDITIPEGRGD